MATKHPINASFRPSKCCTTKLSLGEERITKDKINYPLFALQRAGAAILQTEQEFLDACETLHHRHFAHPLKSFKDTEIDWLKFVRFANDEEVALSNDTEVYKCLVRFRSSTENPQTSEEGKAMFRSCLKQIREGVAPLKALQNVNADTLDTTADLLKFYDDLLARNVTDFADEFPVPKEHWLSFLQFSVGHDLGTPSGMDDAMRDLLEVSHKLKQGTLQKPPIERMDRASEIGRVLETIFASPTYCLPDNQPSEWINEVRALIVQHAPAFLDQFNLALVSPYSGALYPRKEFTATDIAEWSKDPRRTQGWHIISAVLQKLHEIKRTPSKRPL